jgi:hypothetical protein
MLLNKDAVGSATDGVKPDAAGSITILPQRGKPADTVNRLPAPAGNYILTFRLYRPKRQSWTATGCPPSSP